ncbi:S41 family peptidase [Aquidulcibacter paucihalophilus]|jgi:hypothetical protein|nr:S41 family peptidase [Aquidulcibacter paucihalophilus]
MFRSLQLGLISVLLSASLFATAVEADPRRTTQGVAAAIRRNFFDAAAADRIADALEAEAAAGAYDAYADPAELAAVLSDRLKPEDPHFSVSYDSRVAAENMIAGAPPRLSRIESAIISNFGFAEVSVLPGNIGYVQMTRFAEIDFTRSDNVIRAFADAVLTLVSFTDAVIFDLRQNPGGSPSMVGYLVSAFTPRDADIYNTFVGRRGASNERPGVPYATPRLDVPVYILISGRSGSAAEGFAYTLQSAGRALIVGEASGGASNPGDTFPTGDGFSVFVSNATPVNPITGRNWGGAGVQPDLPSPSEEALRVAQRAALTTLAHREDSPGMAQNALWALEALADPIEPSRPLSDFAGSYGGIEIAETPSGLSLRQSRRPARSLVPVRDDLFRIDGDTKTRVQFVRDAEGGVVAMETLSTVASVVRRRRDD